MTDRKRTKRVGHAELFRSTRTTLAHQLTPVVEISANGRLAFLAIRRKGLRRFCQPRFFRCFESCGPTGQKLNLKVGKAPGWAVSYFRFALVHRFELQLHQRLT